MPRNQQPHPGQKPVALENERNSLGKPQVFVQLSWGVSWSDRHMPQTHTISYTSKHLKDARKSGHFPRLESHPQPRRQDSPQRQQQQQQHHHHHSDYERPRGRAGNARPHHVKTLSPPGESRPDARRGSSAPPVIHDGPWSDGEGGPSATLFPRPARTVRNPPHIWKDLPTNPARFRLGEDGLPWSATAWPYDGDDDEDEPPFANLPTTLPLSPPPNRRHSEDPQRVKELESLSTALVTVDNGFENQWWNQGARESTPWFPADSPDEAERPLSTADALLLSAAEPPSGVETYSPISGSFRALVSPLSDNSPVFDSSTGFMMTSPLHRSNTINTINTTRSDELWLDR
ncbi:hypothetical protein F4808DRAFT_188914 [Astrocystis sublimbata]|nr:hypothetical protein F4808DRAFT_188914 [Astrocystis sublimbata]